MLQFGKCIHGYIYRSGLGSDLFVVNGLIDMYGKCGSFEKSRIVFDKSAEINLASWNSLINCFALHGRNCDAIRTFEDMLLCEDEAKPDEVTFVGLLNACTHGGMVVEGRRYFDMMIKEYGIEPQIEHYGCLIDLLGRSGQFEEAMEVVKGMRIPPDEVIWGSLLNGCKIHGRMDLAEYAVKKLIYINPNNGGYRAILANLYGEMGKWDEAQKSIDHIQNGGNLWSFGMSGRYFKAVASTARQRVKSKEVVPAEEIADRIIREIDLGRTAGCKQEAVRDVRTGGPSFRPLGKSSHFLYRVLVSWNQNS
ncbi:Pentatricopeptide repeat-containing protein [Sesamum angolense]|uniref:Pentatricopeptide repeat-containing protein n=1 Tax=Sesamum angolense TaxID=2727404 RepID=A0AAE1WUX1_9LAMI|nr:Pentatricopeptide repeat-containing protein [Sesamum angolense]